MGEGGKTILDRISYCLKLTHPPLHLKKNPQTSFRLRRVLTFIDKPKNKFAMEWWRAYLSVVGESAS